MNLLEVFRPKLQLPVLTSEQVADSVVNLHNQISNLRPVLRRNLPKHAHYRPEWFEGQIEEPDSLEQALIEILARQDLTDRDREESITQEYTSYFEGFRMRNFEIRADLYPLTRELLIYPHRRNPKFWPISVIQLFPWIDFEVELEIGDTITGLPLNGTKEVGGLYKHEFIHLDYLEKMSRHAKSGGRVAYHTPQTQLLVTDLLANRIPNPNLTQAA